MPILANIAEDVDRRVRKQHRDKLRARKAYHVQANLGMTLGQRFIDACGTVQISHADGIRSAVDKWTSGVELRAISGAVPKTQKESSKESELKRVHLLLFSHDWKELGRMYGKGIKRGAVIRTLIRDYLNRIETEGEGKL